ncbi:MAG: ABC transporter ATP-binding protein [Candidatus Latescibacteria bacterium]|nr:ABC transporter ATP-binding protein [Candidatus Latescibacterota bacterium]
MGVSNSALLWSFICNRWKSIAIGSIFVIITNVFNVFIPSFVGRAVDLLRGDFVAVDLYKLCGLILGFEIIMGVSRFFMRYIIIGTSWKLEGDIRNRLFGHMLKLPVTFYNKSRTGDIIARFTNDLTAVRLMIGPAIMYTMNAVLLVPLALGFMFYKNVELALFTLIPFPIMAIMINVVGKKIHKQFVKVQESYSDISAHVQEDLNGIRTVKAFVREEKELESLRKLSFTYLDRNKGVIKLQSFSFPLLDVLASASVLLVLWIGGRKVISGEITLGTIVSFIMYIGIMVWPAIALGWVVAIFERGFASARRIQEILDEEPERQDENVEMDYFKGAIAIHDCSFSYDNNHEVIKNISFDIKPGKTLAIVGKTGSGKSTLLHLLTGAYPVGRGIIFYDDIDINDIPLARLRSSIAYVPQETFLFSETVEENIAFGNKDADFDYIRKAAALASVDKAIEDFPDGYKTLLGERGITVSGGQRQRIAIARALISDAPITIFDDCLSNVDTETEMEILNNIRNFTENKTTIIVTQRLGAIKNADEILYMDAGNIIERGTHHQLMAMEGLYAAHYNEQESIESLGI